MNINDLYPSKYIKADDLQGQQAPVTVMSVTIEEIADKEHKPVMRFMGKEKAMVLNKTNALNCAAVWGDDTITWQGQRATLLAAPVMFQGKQVMGLQLLPTPAQVATDSGGFGAPAAQQVPGNYQTQDAKYQQQFQQPGPHDVQTPIPPHQVTPREVTPGKQVGSGTAAQNAAVAAPLAPAAQVVADLAKDIDAAEHAVDPAGNLDDLPF